MKRTYTNQLVAVLICTLFVGGCATSSPDPYENINRRVHNFNEGADKWVLKPVAQGYRAVAPQFVERGISNIFSNIGEPVVSLNQLLQGKSKNSLRDLGRFVINSTIGFGGIFDPATSLGFEKHQEDFGQTFAVWGIKQGSYLVIPFWGPSNPRDGIGDFIGSYGFLPRYLNDVPARNISYALSIINRRANLLDAEKIVSGDRYVFFRDAYLQRRNYLIKDGIIEDEFLDD